MELWVDRERVDIGPVKQRSVLAVLMLSAGRSVPGAAIIDRVWGDAPPEQVRNTLYSYVARLRRTLRDHLCGPGGGDVLRRRGAGYVLDVPATSVDCHRFRQLVDRARGSAGDDQRRGRLLRQALDQWRGTPLADISGEWADRTRHQLEQCRLGALSEWSDLELAAGEHRLVVDQLHEALAEHPLSEVLTGQLMRAMHLAGRTAEALDCYATTRRRLVAELGTEPGPRLRAIHQDMLRTAAAVSPAPAPRQADPPRWCGVRPHLTRLIGREDERVRLARLLAGERLVTVIGAGGCGKTALALDVAYDLTRRCGIPGVALTLAAATSARQVVRAMCAVLGQPGDRAGSLAAVERILAAGPALLVLDSCEHLAAQLAELVVGLTGSCPGLTVLATSRQPLSVAGEAVFTLEPLAVPVRGDPVDPANPAVALFMERVRQTAPSTTIGAADVGYAAEICRRLDGLPLALELVAARARTFTLVELVDRVGHDTNLLFRTTTPSDSRHRTLDATLDWSFQMLTDHQRRLLARMAVFTAGFTIADVEAVCGFPPLDPAEVAATLAGLVDRSLVQPYDQGGVRRYRLLEVIRNFAARQLTGFGEDDVTHRHYAEHGACHACWTAPISSRRGR